jgi:FlaG/FlaF family flagellin (archaellin)
MVAITVILAAVIGAFVLEIGDQQETAPSTSFDSDQAEKYYANADSSWGPGIKDRNETEVEITHAGGDVLEISQVEIKVNGNASVSDMTEGGTQEAHGGTKAPMAPPQPNVLRTFGTNEPVGFTSGQTWGVTFYDGLNPQNMQPPIKNVVAFLGDDKTTDNDGEPVNHVVVGPTGPVQTYDQTSMLEQGDNVNVVWEASSGGKTQTLFKYTVQ